MIIDIDKVRQEIKTDNRRFALQEIIAAAALLAAGAGIATAGLSFVAQHPHLPGG